MTRYNQKTEASMCLYFSQLNEKDKRHYAATEAIKLGRGGQKYMIDLLGINDRTILRGVQEVLNPSLLSKIPEGKIRQIGGGRKKKNIVTPN